MKSVISRIGGTGAEVVTREEPVVADGEVKLRTLKVGVDGTDLDVIQDIENRVPGGDDYLVLGHETVAEVVDGTTTQFEEGDIVTPFVRRPSEIESKFFEFERPDMAPMGEFVERGIIEAHGFMSEYFTSEPEFLLKLPDELREYGFLVEPISITEKAFEPVESIIASRDWYSPESVLIIGNGRLGLLSAMMLVDDYDVTVYSRSLSSEKKAQLAIESGAEYISSQNVELDELQSEFDIVVETAGVGELLLPGVQTVAPNGFYLVLGLSEDVVLETDVSGFHQDVVFHNKTIIGSVNSHRPHFETAVETLQEMDDALLEQYVELIVSVDNAPEAFTSDVIKSVVSFE